MVTESVEEKLPGVTLNKNFHFKSQLMQYVKKLDKSCMHLHVLQVT